MLLLHTLVAVILSFNHFSSIYRTATLIHILSTFGVVINFVLESFRVRWRCWMTAGLCFLLLCWMLWMFEWNYCECDCAWKHIYFYYSPPRYLFGRCICCTLVVLITLYIRFNCLFFYYLCFLSKLTNKHLNVKLTTHNAVWSHSLAICMFAICTCTVCTCGALTQMLHP